MRGKRLTFDAHQINKGTRKWNLKFDAHFPIKAFMMAPSPTLADSIEICNFLGEAKMNKVDILEGVVVVQSEKF